MCIDEFILKSYFEKNSNFKNDPEGAQDELVYIEYCCNQLLGLVYFSGIFTLERFGDMLGFGVHLILSNPLKYYSPKILYHDGEFLI
jgi:hypothetical protein